ncbi:MAG TPA: UDP-glucose 4-epimerase GalE, partial [Isosphaeraceae bacterium]|nr:UDP-glucose 4-epimerase GalE [Isosphaeraceae bacterium]
DAHLRVLDRLEPGKGLFYNVGTGQGASVLEVIEAARRVTGHPIPAVIRPRRAGDPPALVASPDAIGRELGWTPRYRDIEAIVRTAWKWHSTHPHGFAGT